MITSIAEDIARRGISIRENFIAEDSVRSLSEEIDRLRENGLFRPARVGKGQEAAARRDIRNDEIHWLDLSAAFGELRELRLKIENLRLEINERLFMGLFEFEAHYAVYEPGRYYSRHRDVFTKDDSRKLSFVLYLNEEWKEHDGGRLKIYSPEGNVAVLPRGGTLVTFLSDRYEHEVEPAKRTRKSFTGWFRASPRR